MLLSFDNRLHEIVKNKQNRPSFSWIKQLSQIRIFYSLVAFKRKVFLNRFE